MILRCLFLTAILLSVSNCELIEAECGYIEVTDRGLQCEFNNFYTYDSSVVNIIEQNSSIDAVSFRQSDLYTIPSDIFLKFPLLKHLDVELTQLKVINRDNFLNAEKLKYFLARFNEVKRLESETFYTAPQLKFIVLQHNQISSIDSHAFDGLNNLEALYLDYNQMTFLPPKMLDGVPNLLHFSIAYNNLTSTADDLFARVTKLETLNMGHNMLRTFNDKQFDSLPNLERVQLDHNELSQLDLIGCKSTEINVDKNQLKIIELNKWTRIVSAWGNPVEKLILHEHYGTGRAYNFSFTHVNEIVFFVHEHCCTLENLENFYILTQSFGDLSQKRLDVNDWNCTFVKSIGYDTNSGFVTNNVCKKFRGFAPVTTTTTTSSTTTTTTQIPTTWHYNNYYQTTTTRRGIQNIEDTIFSGEVESNEEEIDSRREQTTSRPSLFAQFDYPTTIKTTTAEIEMEADVQESTTENYEKKAEKGLWKTIKKNASKLKTNVVRKWNEWIG
ncbi:hypothetical protein PVAND_012229 [Polypedilum vanderplanki]|uniref:Uncharacterized protein n=1 Tax=Polypedilum vanderplanki TaxID=319348 RepID=A0A9J6CM38_POLVA|nr:hypothetical protein PVAND_012229 [Polypedilum vanderplanki]